MAKDDDLPWWTLGSTEEQKARYRKAHSSAANKQAEEQTAKKTVVRENVAPNMKDRGQRDILNYPSVMVGRGTTVPKSTKFNPRTNKSQNPNKTSSEYIAPSSPESAQTAGIQGLPGTPGGAAVERGNVTSQGTTQNYETEFPVETFNPPSAPMRKGLFGEDISQEDYDAMTQRNKDASFFGRFKKGGQVKKKTAKKASGGSVSSASKRGDGCCQRGKTKGRMV
jgi:hypothetical protein